MTRFNVITTLLAAGAIFAGAAMWAATKDRDALTVIMIGAIVLWCNEGNDD
jgi:uncharacterized membrane protein YhfC